MSRTASACKLARHSKASNPLNAWIFKRESIPGSVEEHEALPKAKTHAGRGSSPRRLAVKDNICTTNEETTCASGTLLRFRSPLAATVVQRSEAAGYKIAGKTNLDEFGMGYVPQLH